MSTVMHSVQRGNADRKQRWERTRRAALLDQYRALRAEGRSQRQAANTLLLGRITRRTSSMCRTNCARPSQRLWPPDSGQPHRP